MKEYDHRLLRKVDRLSLRIAHATILSTILEV